MKNDELIAIKPVPETAVDTIVHEVARAQGVARYLTQLLRRYRSAPSLTLMTELAYIVEPPDPQLGRDPELPLGGAFIAGSLLGLRLVRTCVAKADLEPVIDSGSTKLLRSSTAVGVDQFVVERQFAGEVLDFGLDGYHIVEAAFEAPLTKWATDVYHDDARQRHFMRCGLGTPVAMMASVDDQNQQIRQARAYDWSAALGELS